LGEAVSLAEVLECRAIRKIFLLGHSAGAAIVSSIACDENYLRVIDRKVLKGCISLDTEGYDVSLQVQQGNTIYEQAFGTNPIVTEDASPITHIRGGNDTPPFLVVTRGPIDRVLQAKSFSDKLLSYEIPSKLLNAQGYTHEGINDAVGKDNVITPAIVEFIRQNLGQ